MNLEVGNLLYLHNGDAVPADFIIFATSNSDGVCYIETANLDGENNLKTKEAALNTGQIFEDPLINSMKNLHKLDEGVLKSEHPNNRLYKYEGSLLLKDFDKPISIDQDNMILRGSTIRNTK